jgi:tetratricopeptide (TPR) repeat protein
MSLGNNTLSLCSWKHSVYIIGLPIIHWLGHLHSQFYSIRLLNRDFRLPCLIRLRLPLYSVLSSHWLAFYTCIQINQPLIAYHLCFLQELKDSAAEAQAHGNMGLTRMNLLHFEEAIANFEKELECLDARLAASGQPAPAAASPSANGVTAAHPPPPAPATKEKARALGSLGDCFDALGDYNQSVRYHEQFLRLALETGSLRDQDKAYRGLGLANKNLGNLQEALVSFIRVSYFFFKVPFPALFFFILYFSYETCINTIFILGLDFACWVSS